ncbi:MAG: amidohydrolase family protein [Prochloraceae cyanobacterium]
MNIKLNNLFVSLRSAPWSYRILLGSITFILIAAFTPPPATATLFENVRIFDGVSEQLSAPANVLVVGNKIQTISQKRIPAPSRVRLTRIKGNGRTLMPGLSDAHWHFNLASSNPVAVLNPNITNEEAEAIIRANSQTTAEKMLMRGFTSVRDVGGNTFWLKKAIDAGKLVGPRIWPSGAMISQTSGHFDFRPLEDIPITADAPLVRTEKLGITMVADGVPEVLQRVREQLKQGASQIKIATGGGVASDFDPLDVTQYTEDEIRAAVQAAADWGTYVTTHTFSPASIQRSIQMGIKCIEHGHLLDEETARLMAKTGTWLSMQPVLDDEDALIPEGSPPFNRAKFLQVVEGTDRAYRLAKQYNVKTAWGTDTLFDPRLVERQLFQLTKMVRWYEPWEVLKMATHDNQELFALSGPRNPYPGKLGVVQEGALADLILVNGNPIQNIQLIADPEKNFLIIMKDGKIYKNAF